MALSQEKANLIASEYKASKCDMTKGLLGAGYSKSYAETLGHKLYSNIKVINAIEAINKHQRIKTGRTIESLDGMYQAAYDLANTSNQPSAMNQSVTGIARLYGLDKDTVDTTQQQALTDNEQAEANRLATIRLREA